MSVIQTPAFSAGYIGRDDLPRKPLTDKHGIQIVVDSLLRGEIRAWICGDAAMTNYAAVALYTGFDGDAARIVTGSSPSLVAPQKQLDLIDSARITSVTTFKFRYDPTANKFLVLRNDQEVLTWPDLGANSTDPANLVSHGSTKRFVGVVSNAHDDPENRGLGIRSVNFHDW